MSFYSTVLLTDLIVFLFSVDVWDGPEMPIVYHGNTLTSKIAFSDVISVIAQFAFEASKSVDIFNNGTSIILSW